MAPPQYTDALPGNVFLRVSENGGLTCSDGAIGLLRASRENYAWPFATTPTDSQQDIIDIERAVGEWTNALSVEIAHQIVVRVSKWAGNRRHQHVVDANDREMVVMFKSVRALLDEEDLPEGLEKLSHVPGISLVIATKIFRFCRPMAGAAVDRHASYFFNSFPVISDNAPITRSTAFRREWTNGAHRNSRLATFAPGVLSINLTEYAATYLPLVGGIATTLNAAGVHFTCAATGNQKSWTPADVEMAAFSWWAQHGSR